MAKPASTRSLATVKAPSQRIASANPGTASEIAPNPPTPIYISITGDGQSYLGDGIVELDQIGAELTAQIGRRNPADERIFIRADKTTRYGDFMQVMNSLQDNGFYSVALVGEDTASQ